MKKGVEMSEMDDLFAEARARPHSVSQALQARVLADALRLQPRVFARPAARGFWAPGFWAPGLWARVSGLLGGLGVLAGPGMLAGMTTAAVAGVYLGFAQPGAIAGFSVAWLADAPLEAVELLPGMDGFLSGGEADE